MRRVLAGLVLVGTMACGSDMTGPPKADVAGPCWVTAKAITVVNGNQVVTLGAKAHYAVCPSKQSLDATLGTGTYTVTPG